MATEAEKQSAPKKTRRKSKSALVKKAIQNIEDKIATNEVKATYGDFIRLLQLEKELTVDQPRDIKVTWVEPNQKEPASDK